MKAWTLTVLLDSELESCDFATVREVKAVLRSLLSDYGVRLSRASVTDPAGRLKLLSLARLMQREAKERGLFLNNCLPAPEVAK
jgi:hypothetical protein